MSPGPAVGRTPEGFDGLGPDVVTGDGGTV